MTDHLPECMELNAFDSQYGYTTSCKCERLRVYAAKVRMEDDDYAHVAAQAEAEGRRCGWNEALDAARAAVRHALGPMDTDDPGQHDAALAAIDALREEQK